MKEREALNAFARKFVVEVSLMKKQTLAMENPKEWPIEAFKNGLSIPLSLFLVDLLKEGLLMSALDFLRRTKARNLFLHPAILPGLLEALPRERKLLSALQEVLPPQIFQLLLQKKGMRWEPLLTVLEPRQTESLGLHLAAHLQVDTRGEMALDLASFVQPKDPLLQKIFEEFALERTKGGVTDLASYLPAEFWEREGKRRGIEWVRLLRNRSLSLPLIRMLCASYARAKSEQTLQKLGEALLESGCFFPQTSSVFRSLGPKFYFLCMEKVLDEQRNIHEIDTLLLDKAPFVLNEKLSWRLFSLCKEESLAMDFPRANTSKNLLRIAKENLHPILAESIRSPHWQELKHFLRIKKMNFSDLATFTP